MEDWYIWKGGMAQWLGSQLGASEGLQLNTPEMTWLNSITPQAPAFQAGTQAWDASVEL